MTETEIKEALKKLDAALSGKPKKPRFPLEPGALSTRPEDPETGGHDPPGGVEKSRTEPKEES